MEVWYKCTVVKYAPSINAKPHVIFILNFDFETDRFQKMVNNLLNDPIYVPMEPIPIVNQFIGECSELYYTPIGCEVEIEFLNKNNMMFHFSTLSINETLNNEQLDELRVRSISELCEGNIPTNVILTNCVFGQNHDEKAKTYYISSDRNIY